MPPKAARPPKKGTTIVDSDPTYSSTYVAPCTRRHAYMLTIAVAHASSAVQVCFHLCVSSFDEYHLHPSIHPFIDTVRPPIH
jgi:hypothetical protein